MTVEEAYFVAAFKVANTILGSRALADEFKVSESTISKYVRGKNLPVEEVRPIVLERLTRLLESAEVRKSYKSLWQGDDSDDEPRTAGYICGGGIQLG